MLFIALLWKRFQYLYRRWINKSWIFKILEKECGAFPEGVNKYSYHFDVYGQYTQTTYNTYLEAVMYISDEIFDPDNYNENSIKRESKISFHPV